MNQQIKVWRNCNITMIDYNEQNICTTTHSKFNVKMSTCTKSYWHLMETNTG